MIGLVILNRSVLTCDLCVIQNYSFNSYGLWHIMHVYFGLSFEFRLFCLSLLLPFIEFSKIHLTNLTGFTKSSEPSFLLLHVLSSTAVGIIDASLISYYCI